MIIARCLLYDDYCPFLVDVQTIPEITTTTYMIKETAFHRFLTKKTTRSPYRFYELSFQISEILMQRNTRSRKDIN